MIAVTMSHIFSLKAHHWPAGLIHGKEWLQQHIKRKTIL
jgi:hypothetical protein